MIGRKLYEAPEPSDSSPAVAGSLVSEFAPSRYQALADRAEELAGTANRRILSCREQGQHPRATPASVQDLSDMAHLVRDLAKAITEIR